MIAIPIYKNVTTGLRVRREDTKLDNVARWVRVEDYEPEDAAVAYDIDPDEPSTEVLADLADAGEQAPVNVAGEPDEDSDPEPFKQPVDEASTEVLEQMTEQVDGAPVNFAGDPAADSDPEPFKAPVDESVAEQSDGRVAREVSPGWYQVDGEDKKVRRSQIPDGVEIIEQD